MSISQLAQEWLDCEATHDVRCATEQTLEPAISVTVGANTELFRLADVWEGSPRVSTEAPFDGP
jgi:hypothetical protein